MDDSHDYQLLIYLVGLIISKINSLEVQLNVYISETKKYVTKKEKSAFFYELGEVNRQQDRKKQLARDQLNKFIRQKIGSKRLAQQVYVKVYKSLGDNPILSNFH